MIEVFIGTSGFVVVAIGFTIFAAFAALAVGAYCCGRALAAKIMKWGRGR